MPLADQFEFSKKKVVLHLVYPLEIHTEPCYSDLQAGLYLKDAMTEQSEKPNIYFSPQEPYEHTVQKQEMQEDTEAIAISCFHSYV